MPKRYRTATVYCCWKCGRQHSPAIYAVRDELAREAAIKAAQQCCEPKKCQRCHTEMDRHNPYTACTPCREILKAHRVRIVTADECDEGVIYSPTHQGNWNDGYSSSIEEMLELHADEGWEPPAYVHPCSANKFAFDPTDVIDRCHDDHHEDAADQIEDRDGLFEFFKNWNAKQSITSYWPQYDRVIVLDQERFNALLNQPKELHQ